MKYVVAAYILWLAIHIAIGKPETSKNQGGSFIPEGIYATVCEY